MYQAFDSKRVEIEDICLKDRKKAKLVYRKDNTTADILGVSGPIPRIYLKCFEASNKFYISALSDRNISLALGPYGIT